LWREKRGQDMVEYALMAALVATGVGAFVPTQIYPAYSTIWARISAVTMTLTGVGS
jgi:Flp pilus assembly pilin Flp